MGEKGQTIGPMTLQHSAAVVLLQAACVLADNRRYFNSFDSFGSFGRRRNDDRCYNDAYNTRTDSDQCANDCCWGDSCGTEGECRKAVIIGCIIAAVVVLSICGCIAWCFFSRKLCWSSHDHYHDSHQQAHVQYPVSVTQPQQMVYTNQHATGQPYPQAQYPQGQAQYPQGQAQYPQGQVFQGQPYPQAQAQPVYGGQPAPPPPPAYVAKEPPQS